MDVYGFITNTNYKYVLIKNETKTSNIGMKPSDDQVRMVRNAYMFKIPLQFFKALIRVHTELMLNPFFEPSEHGGISDQETLEQYDSDDDQVMNPLPQVLGNQRYIDVLQFKLSEIANQYDKLF